MKTKLIYLLFTVAFFCSCSDIIEKNTPENVFEVFWRTLDENYVYFEEKGIDWDSIYSIYAPQAQTAKGDKDLERIFEEIIPLFKDKHLSVKWIRYLAPEDSAMIFYTSTPISFIGFERKYSDDNHYSAYEYSEKDIAYIAIQSFLFDDNQVYDKMVSNLEKALSALECSNGLIIDLRNNEGGTPHYLYNFISSFYTGKKVLLYRQDKLGKGHNDFDDKISVTIEGKGYISDNIPIVILTNSITYSAANIAVYMLKDIRECTVIGEATGGGGGGRRDVILPNRWTLSFPCNKLSSPSGKNMEYRLEPDIYVKHYNEFDSNYDKYYGDSIFVRALVFLANLQKNK